MKIFSKEKWENTSRSCHFSKEFLKFVPEERQWWNMCDGKSIEECKRMGFEISEDWCIEVRNTKETKPAQNRYQILIECDNGKITSATMVVNGKIVKDAVAKLNPEDKFSFRKGAELAFARLFEKNR